MSNQPGSLLQHALQNLHVSAQPSGSLSRPTSLTGHSRHLSADSSRTSGVSEDGDDVLIEVGQDTRAPTRVPSRMPSPRLAPVDLPDPSGRGIKSRDPLRVLPTHLAVRVFLQLDIRSLARCDRVCKRWHKSSTLNYVWYLQNRSLLLPHLATTGSGPEGKVVRRGDDTPDYFDPYDKSPRLRSLPTPALPPSAEPVWTKLESRKSWKTLFRTTLKRSDPRQEEEEDHPYHVNIDSLQTSGTSTPNGGRGHSYAGLGSGHAARWAGEEGAAMTPTEKKIAAREGYKVLGGRKSRAKRKVGMELGRDKGGGAPDDGRFDAPW